MATRGGRTGGLGRRGFVKKVGGLTATAAGERRTVGVVMRSGVLAVPVRGGTRCLAVRLR